MNFVWRAQRPSSRQHESDWLLFATATVLYFYCLFLQWVGRTVAASLGVGLILIQVLSHYNVITVNWSVVHKQAVQVLDRTGDG